MGSGLTARILMVTKSGGQHQDSGQMDVHPYPRKGFDPYPSKEAMEKEGH